MKIILHSSIALFLIIVFSSCKTEIDFSGAWASYHEEVYSEMYVSRDCIDFLSIITIGPPKVQYTIRKDSIFYNNTRFKIDMINHHHYTLNYDQHVIHIYRMSDDIKLEKYRPDKLVFRQVSFCLNHDLISNEEAYDIICGKD